MNNEYSQSISEFLSETAPLMEQLDILPLDAATELYDLLDEAANTAIAHISMIDPELRVELCIRLDLVIERIVDVLPPYRHSGSPVKIFTPAIQFYSKWENVNLMKDCGLMGYMLAKELNAIPVMYFASKPENYPYLSILPQMEMLYTDSEFCTADTYYEHLKASYADMDVLLIYGLYSHAIGYLDVYRKLRPDGKVYCGLDMNSWWMSNTPWDSLEARNFAEQCDIIATSCRQMRDALNRNPQVHFPCRWLTNGFYNPTDVPVIADPDKKENILLTVGRIGTFQKNNEEMLTAFAEVSSVLEGWSLRLVGSIEPEFQEYISNYFVKHPHLKNRVIFTGSIMDKTDLYREYARAKIFILSSRLEGGTPNVYAEALFHGCMFITSDVDAADDIINYDELGAKYPIGDAGALADVLVRTCKKADRAGMRNHVPKALKYARQYFDWYRSAKKLAYMLFKKGPML